MITLDLDGTLLDYNYLPGRMPQLNYDLVDRLYFDANTTGNRFVSIVTNQGGLPFGMRRLAAIDGRPYPHPTIFVVRLFAVVTALARYDLKVDSIRVCLYHPRANADDVERVAQVLRPMLSFFENTVVYTTAKARKPSPLMLKSVGATCYYGDSDEDAAAAQAASIPFYRVTRFYRGD